MPKAFSCVSLLITSTILSLLEHWWKERKMTRPIRIRLTSQSLVVCAVLEQQPNASSMHCYLARELASLLKSLAAAQPKRKKLLSVLWFGTQDGSSLRRKSFQRMLNGDGFKDWTVARYEFRERR